MQYKIHPIISRPHTQVTTKSDQLRVDLTVKYFLNKII
jgi:hypothetical protein